MKIANDCIAKEAMRNNKIVPLQDIIHETVSDNYLYEIIRIIQHIPLFAEDHHKRLQYSISILNKVNPISFESLNRSLIEYINAINLLEGNIKIVFDFDQTNLINYYIYQIKHSYPKAELYSKGVNICILHAERSNPNAKQNQPIRTKANNLIAKTDTYEALYIDHNGNALEGSRSNIFFIKGNAVYTAPSEKVLKGITRKYVIEAIIKSGLTIIEGDIREAELNEFDAAFMTGTSPKVLPIASIKDCNYDPINPNLRKIMFEYDRIFMNYISKSKNR